MNEYGLIGFPLGHSFSKQYFTQKFEKEGIQDCSFTLFPLENIEQLNDLLSTQPHLKGLAVTIPYKQSVIPFLHSISNEAAEIAAVNCIEFLPEGLKGHNTDVTGFKKSFLPFLKHHHTKALVLGTGGGSKAVQFVLSKMGIPFLLVSRFPENDASISYLQVNKQLLREYTIVINTTPVGMYPYENNCPDIPYQCITPNHFLFDLIYKPEETKFLQMGKEKGATIKNGYQMLIIQAEENWRIWNKQ